MPSAAIVSQALSACSPRGEISPRRKRDDYSGFFAAEFGFRDGAILINKKGERFAEETKGMVFDMAYQPDGIAYILFDASVAKKYTQWPHYVSTAPGIAFAYLQDYENTRPDLFRRGETLAALAGKLGMDAPTLQKTVQTYNASAEARGTRPAIGDGPYIALGPVRNYINYTDGGLAINKIGRAHV